MPEFDLEPKNLKDTAEKISAMLTGKRLAISADGQTTYSCLSKGELYTDEVAYYTNSRGKGHKVKAATLVLRTEEKTYIFSTERGAVQMNFGRDYVEIRQKDMSGYQKRYEFKVVK